MPTGIYKRTESYKNKQREIALKNGYGKWMMGKKHTQETKEKMGLAHQGDKNHNWLGIDVGYVSLHEWVNRKLGQPDTCEFCGELGLKGQRIHWASKSREYKRDLNDWLQLCVSYHWKYDQSWLKRDRDFQGRFI